MDSFIPDRLRRDLDIVQAVRMFVFSHLFGPFLGHTISFYIVFEMGTADGAWWVLFLSITAFWPLGALLKVTRHYVPLALVSIQNLIFVILWGCYHYGGISSPILPWMVTVPLLAFFYLPQPRLRIIVLLIIVANLVAFDAIYSWYGFRAEVSVRDLASMGFVSTFCAGIYVSMMALYYRNIVSSQGELEQEVRLHRDTARQLRQATEQANRAVLAKTEFLANMSHELRAPLNVIIGYSEILIEETAPGGQQAQDLLAIRDAGKSLLRGINDLLDLAKLEAGRMELSAEQFELDALIDEVVDQWHGPISEKGVLLQVTRPDAFGVFVSDRAKLRQILWRLLENATKFTENGTITVFAARQADDVTIAVRDTGVGIHSDELEGLFESFSIRKDETTSGYREPSLGLPLCYRLCGLLGGTLTVDSTVGGGTSFTVRLPSHVDRQVVPCREPEPQPLVRPGSRSKKKGFRPNDLVGSNVGA
ncbi:sensor histidine kinase [Rhodospirillaceae bacterium SYSU D60014]|uniref:sensor histidine kinase n=1 Tax=Virgifigura deserti TaxID=2268457 RepID=UPI0013C40AFC